MVDYVKGQVKALKDQAIVVDLGIVGLHVQVPTSTHYQMEESVHLWLYMHWNQENGPSLFGFKTEFERQIFLLIISCNGIGPKIALSALGDLGATKFVHAVNSGDDKVLSGVSGIGPKKAEQMIVSLKHKVAKLIASGAAVDGVASGEFEQWHNVSEVLASLNYNRTEIAAAMRHISESAQPANASFDLLVRQALSFLAKRT